jgi:hypothetical protein
MDIRRILLLELQNRIACELHTGLLSDILTEFWPTVMHEKL